MSSKIHEIFKKQKEAGGSGGGSPPLRAGRPPRAPEARAAAPLLIKLQSVLFLPDCWRIAFVSSKVIFGYILAITYTSQIKVILGPPKLL